MRRHIDMKINEESKIFPATQKVALSRPVKLPSVP